MGDMPSYEAIRVPGRGRGPTAILMPRLMAMESGAVILARDLWQREVKRATVGSMVNRVNNHLGRTEFVIRLRNGLLYVVRLKDEDIGGDS